MYVFSKVKTKKLVLVASIAATFSAAASPALADLESLIDKLHEKGVLTDEEYSEMSEEARAARREEAVKAGEEKDPALMKSKFANGFSWQSGDDQHELALSGRVHTDYRNFGPADAAAKTYDVRRAYLTIKGKVYEGITFDVTGDFANNVNNSQLDVAWVNLGFMPQAQLRFGQFKMPFSIEELTSSRFIDFQERSLVNALVPQKERGAMLWGLPYQGVTYGLALSTGQGKNNNDTIPSTASDDVIGRVTMNFAEMMNKDDMVLHVGGAFSEGTQPTNFSLAQRTEGRGVTFFSTTSPAFSGEDLDRSRRGLEAVFAWGPIKLQGETVTVDYSGTSNGGVDYEREIEASYLEALWLVTGEHYAEAYKNGAFGRISPNREFKYRGDGWGAFEVGVRFSTYDASDFTAGNAPGTGVLGSTSGTPSVIATTNKAEAWTLGAKWILNPNFKFYLNYVETHFDTPITIDPNYGGLPAFAVDKERAFTVRAALDF